MFAVGCEQHRSPEVVEVPQAFLGWAVIAWDVAGYAALPKDGAKFIERIPSDGILITSTHQEFGWASDEFYLVDDSGKRSQNAQNVTTHHAVTGSKGADKHSLHFTAFFVGTPTEASAANKDASDRKIDEAFNRIKP